MAKRSFVHELAHIWDVANHEGLSEGMEQATGGITLKDGRYFVGGTAASVYAGTNRKEDFAESVAASVYPTMKIYTTQGKKNMDRNRSKFVEALFYSASKVNH